MAPTLIVEADGGSRGNPGIAGYGALVRDATTGRVLAELAAPLGKASNNVAEYSGLIAGLGAAYDLDPQASVLVRMDSKLVVEQMAGRWKIKHEDMRRLALDAREIVRRFDAAGGSVDFQWIPRAENLHADKLSNVGMDGEVVHRVHDAGSGSTQFGDAGDAGAAGDGAGIDSGSPLVPPPEPLPRPARDRREAASKVGTPPPDAGPGTRIVFVRHGVTDLTIHGRLDGRGGSNPQLNAEGMRQAVAAGRGVLAFLGRDEPVRVIASSLARAHQTGQAVAAALGARCEVDRDWDEVAFGAWDGMSMAEVVAKDPSAVGLAYADPDFAPAGGESRLQLVERVTDALARALESGGTVVVAAHRGPIIAALGSLLGVGMEAMTPFQTGPASLTSVRVWSDGGVAVEFVNDRSHLR